MKMLYLVRHAKSSWGLSDLPDIDRPLNERGYRDAHGMSKHLLGKITVPGQIISSPACRALSTALIFSRTLQYPAENLMINSRLYENTPAEYRDVVRETDHQASSLMLVAHNFAISEFAAGLLEEPFEEMPTCGVLAIRFKTDTWTEIGRIKGEKEFYLFPKNINPT